MTPPALLFVTGASGAGKTTAVRALEGRGIAGIRCHYFDSVGVPSPAEMIRDYGSGEAWQAAMTEQWVRRLAADSAEVAVLDGQARPSVIRAALADVGQPNAQIVLLDCSVEERARRLAGPRRQPELASPEMSAWAAYLRGQADAFALTVIDTTGQSIEVVTDALAAEVERLRLSRGRAPGGPGMDFDLAAGIAVLGARRTPSVRCSPGSRNRGPGRPRAPRPGARTASSAI